MDSYMDDDISELRNMEDEEEKEKTRILVDEDEAQRESCIKQEFEAYKTMYTGVEDFAYNFEDYPWGNSHWITRDHRNYMFKMDRMVKSRTFLYRSNLLAKMEQISTEIVENG